MFGIWYLDGRPVDPDHVYKKIDEKSLHDLLINLYPFSEHAVVDFALSSPRRLYYKNGINRYIFRKAFSFSGV